MQISGEVGGRYSNSYVVSINEAEDILAGILYHDEWDVATDDTKMAALIRATEIIDTFEPYRYGKYYGTAYGDNEQALQFPRQNHYDDSGNLYIPREVKKAQVMQANYMLRKGSHTREDLRNQGVGSIRIGKWWEFLTGWSCLICVEAATILMQFVDKTGSAYAPGRYLG